MRVFKRMSQFLPADRRPPLSFALLWIGAWAMLLLQLGVEWWRNPQYGYGLVVPLLCVWILWERRDEWAGVFDGAAVTKPRLSRTGPFLFLCAISPLPLELLREVSPQLRSIGIYGSALCLSLTFWTLRRMGAQRVPRVALGVALLFATAVPWPLAVEVWVTQSLMKGIASFTADVVSLCGILAMHRGNLIELRSGMLSVDEACSGVRSLQSCIMASVAIGQFHRLASSRQAVLLAGGVMLALAGNLVRTLALTLVAASRGMESVHPFHDPAGWIILVGVTLVLFWVGKRLAVPMQKTTARWEWPDFGCLPRSWGALVTALVSLVAAHLWYWTHDARWPMQTEPFLVMRTTAGFRVDEIPVPSSIEKVLQSDRSAYYQCASREWGDAAVYSFFWLPTRENQVGFFHRPDICMSGAGWEMKGEVREVSVQISGVKTTWYLFTFEREHRRLIQAWGVWRDGVEQKLDFSRGWRFLSGQHMQIWQYVLEGRRVSNIQVVSVILDAQAGGESRMATVISHLLEARQRRSP